MSGVKGGTRPLVVIDVVGLTPTFLEAGWTPHISELAREGFWASIDGVFPALTCSAQSTYLTGTNPNSHGIVGNGWFFRDLSEIWLWRQSNHLVQGEKIWEALRRLDPDSRTASLFWWYNMASSVDWAVTPRPVYHADGRKDPDIYTVPAELGEHLQGELGTFPLFNFWGPAAGRSSTEWIVESSIRVIREKQPELCLVYLPHLDYDLQRFGPRGATVEGEVRFVDQEVGRLIGAARERGAEVVCLSEYGIEEVAGPVHINRHLREAGFLSVTTNAAGELLDPGQSRAFAVADHQIAHVYVSRQSDRQAVRECLQSLDGVETVLDQEGQRAYGVDHERCGEFLAVSRKDRWFSYYYWIDEALAPDFARTVEIHRKPGYDPVELFLDPSIAFPKWAILRRLMRKKCGFRTLMDVVGLDASLVRGSHGRLADDSKSGPILVSSSAVEARDTIRATEVQEFLLGIMRAR